MHWLSYARLGFWAWKEKSEVERSRSFKEGRALRMFKTFCWYVSILCARQGFIPIVCEEANLPRLAHTGHWEGTGMCSCVVRR